MSSDLCEEMILEIFTRLPSKSLLRFRSLSKSVCSSVASPDFIRKHTSRSPKTLLIRHIVDDENRKSVYTLHSANQLPLFRNHGYTGIEAVDESPYDRRWKCVGSCNGILCMFNGGQVSLWNPSIRCKLALPDCPRGYSPLRSGHDLDRIGFGFDPISDNYKIVSLPKNEGSGKSSYVFSMKAGVWCKIASPPPSFDYVGSHARLVNGALHWVVKSRSDDDDYYIMTFNLSTYVFGRIDLPQADWGVSEQLMTIQGSLALLSRINDEWWIWVMREYGNTASWAGFFKTRAVQVERKFYVVFPQTVDGVLLFQTSYKGFQAYDPEIGVQSRLRNLDVDCRIFDMETFGESLQLFNVGT